MRDFDGLSVLVTGGNSGIGLAAAEELASRGARVAILDRNEPSRQSEFVQVVADLADHDGVVDACAQAADALGGVDVLVNNAGTASRGTAQDASDGEWGRVLDINVVGLARVTRAVLPYLLESPQAAIVNTCSVSANVGMGGLVAYSASKGAVASLTRALAADLIGRVRVNSVSPGTVDTPWIRSYIEASPDPAATEAQVRARQPLGRLISPEEVAWAIAYLASPRTGSTTGVDLPVDAGMTAIISNQSAQL